MFVKRKSLSHCQYANKPASLVINTGVKFELQPRRAGIYCPSILSGFTHSVLPFLWVKTQLNSFHAPLVSHLYQMRYFYMGNPGDIEKAARQVLTALYCIVKVRASVTAARFN